MSSFPFIDPLIYIHGFDMTTYLNSLKVNASAEELDNTTFGGGGYRSRIGGLKTVEMSAEGFWDSPADAENFGDLGVSNRVVTVSPTHTEGDPAYIFRVGRFHYEMGGEIGAVMPFTLDAMNTDSQGMIRGKTAKVKGTVSATGQLGSGLNLGAPAAGQYVYASLHIFSAGTTITIDVESDDNANFTSATQRAVIGPLTTSGGTWMTRVAGPFSGETHWRFNVTAITGSFSVAGAIAVQ